MYSKVSHFASSIEFVIQHGIYYSARSIYHWRMCELFSRTVWKRGLNVTWSRKILYGFLMMTISSNGAFSRLSVRFTKKNFPLQFSGPTWPEKFENSLKTREMFSVHSRPKSLQRGVVFGNSRTGKYNDYRYMITFEKLRFQNIFRRH